MKKILFLLAIAATSMANAQKGTYLVSGYFNYQTENNTNAGTTDYGYFGFSPKVGYQFSENWSLGVETGVNSQKWENDNSYENKRNNLAVGGFVRYSKPLNDSFSFFTDFGLGYLHRKETLQSELNSSNTKSTGFYATLQPMIFLKVKSNFGINFGLGGIYFNSLENKDSNNTQNTFNINFGQAFTLGIQKNF